eukprot:5888462-Pyramimonas_sp.AAC.1
MLLFGPCTKAFSGCLTRKITRHLASPHASDSSGKRHPQPRKLRQARKPADWPGHPRYPECLDRD